jgi:hypothetical protein
MATRRVSVTRWPAPSLADWLEPWSGRCDSARSRCARPVRFKVRTVTTVRATVIAAPRSAWGRCAATRACAPNHSWTSAAPRAFPPTCSVTPPSIATRSCSARSSTSTTPRNARARIRSASRSLRSTSKVAWTAGASGSYHAISLRPSAPPRIRHWRARSKPRATSPTPSSCRPSWGPRARPTWGRSFRRFATEASSSSRHRQPAPP